LIALINTAANRSQETAFPKSVFIASIARETDNNPDITKPSQACCPKAAVS
jgi:hypothetical protein